MKANNADHMVL